MTEKTSEYDAATNPFEYCDFVPLFCMIDELLQKKKQVFVAIDGNSAAGKSSLSMLLKSVYSCNVFSMDDFFLRPCQRTPERLSEPGGNVDYERFEKEIIGALQSGIPFTYQAYDCQSRELSEPRAIAPNRLNVIEGVYCLHPRLFSTYDIKVFLSLDAAEQRNRLAKRNISLYDRFMDEWIPMENNYFEVFQIPAKCDFVFGANSA